MIRSVQYWIRSMKITAVAGESNVVYGVDLFCFNWKNPLCIYYGCAPALYLDLVAHLVGFHPYSKSKNNYYPSSLYLLTSWSWHDATFFRERLDRWIVFRCGSSLMIVLLSSVGKAPAHSRWKLFCPSPTYLVEPIYSQELLSCQIISHLRYRQFRLLGNLFQPFFKKPCLFFLGFFFFNRFF